MCDFCSFSNHNLLNSCEICENEKVMLKQLNINNVQDINNSIKNNDSWICNQCTFINDNVELNCIICNQK